MKLRITTRRPCELARGEARRVPQPPGALVGYHVGCPRCGFVTPLLVGDGRLQIVEGAAGLTTSRSVRCLACRVQLRLRDGVLQLEEGLDVRPLVRR